MPSSFGVVRTCSCLYSGIGWGGGGGGARGHFSIINAQGVISKLCLFWIQGPASFLKTCDISPSIGVLRLQHLQNQEFAFLIGPVLTSQGSWSIVFC